MISEETRKCMACPKASPFIAVGEGKTVSLSHATDEFAAVSITFRDEDQPYGWPEVDA